MSTWKIVTRIQIRQKDGISGGGTFPSIDLLYKFPARKLFIIFMGMYIMLYCLQKGFSILEKSVTVMIQCNDTVSEKLNININDIPIIRLLSLKMMNFEQQYENYVAMFSTDEERACL